jgi:hypothetical protein
VGFAKALPGSVLKPTNVYRRSPRRARFYLHIMAFLKEKMQMLWCKGAPLFIIQLNEFTIRGVSQ